MSSLVGKFFGLENNLLGRAVSEIRRSVPVMLHHHGVYSLVFASELLEEHFLSVFTSFSDSVFLLLTAQRAAFVSSSNILTRVHANGMKLSEIHALLTELPGSIPSVKNLPSTCPLDILAIDLVKMAKLLPSALVVSMKFDNQQDMKMWCDKNHILYVESSVLSGYCKKYDLQEVCRSDLYLKDSLKTKMIVYRPNTGELEHYAIIIGNPDPDNMLVRIHSSCYTGDLLGSLSCDCRSQLLSAVKLLSHHGGGVVLYISQEGRGIGIANKIRAYCLQMQNSFDTVDANRFLGFDDDERVFLPAALILERLGINRLQLLTSNPKKVKAISKYGLTVTRIIPFCAEINEHNEEYIRTKQMRLGHLNI